MSNVLKQAGWAPGTSVATATTAVLLAVLAVQTARLGWATFAPIGPVGEPESTLPPARPSADFAALDRFDPFFRITQVSAQATPTGVTNGMKLFGVRAGRGASAIISGPDGRQSPYLIGETIAPGVTLYSVAADHVILNVDGRRSTLHFGPPSAEAPVVPAVFAPPPPPPPPPIPSSAAEALARAGMMPGDTVLSVNGSTVEEPGQAENIAREIAARRGSATIQFERDGQVRTATLDLSNP